MLQKYPPDSARNRFRPFPASNHAGARVRILLSNDDGIHSTGLKALHEALKDEHEVVVVAPDRERSAAGHSLTLHHPLRVV